MSYHTHNNQIQTKSNTCRPSHMKPSKPMKMESAHQHHQDPPSLVSLEQVPTFE